MREEIEEGERENDVLLLKKDKDIGWESSSVRKVSQGVCYDFVFCVSLRICMKKRMFLWVYFLPILTNLLRLFFSDFASKCGNKVITHSLTYFSHRR